MTLSATPPSTSPSTTPARSEVSAAVEKVAAHQDAWRRTADADRAALLRQCMRTALAAAPDWVAATCEAKGIAPGSPLTGEEWLASPMTTIRGLRLYAETLSGRGLPESAWFERPDGQKLARVFPTSTFDKLLFGGVTGEVWVEPGQPATAGTPGPGGVAGVLGAGNVSSIGPLDVFDQLVVHDRVAILKMNPVNEYVGPHLEAAMKPLIEAGFVAVVYGGAEAGAELVHHEQVDVVHLTGSDRTYDAIVWGGDRAEQQRRKESGQKALEKPVSAELGCVTPVMVVPGRWSAADLRYQAQQVAGMVVHNASHNCNAAKLLVTCKRWPQRQAFLDEVRKALTAATPRLCYYPGSDAKYAGFLEAYPQAERLGGERDGGVPWTLVADVPAEPGQYAFQNEAWCGLLAETALDADDDADYLQKVVPFVNEHVWGSLSCVVLAPKSTSAAALDRAVADLRYGGVGVNLWAALIYGACSTTWGAFPGHTPEDIQSGVGVVHNTYRVDHPQKSVMRAPFRMKPKPVWFPGHRTLDQIGRRITAFEAQPGWGKIPGLVLQALRG